MSKLKISRNILFALIIAGITATIIIDLFLVERKLFSPLDYFYAFFSVFMLFYIVYPLYINRRLTAYYWERTKKNKLSILGLFFIVFLVLLAIAGPFFTVNPNQVNFEEKNLPPLGFTVTQSIYDRDRGSFSTEELPGT